MVDLLYIQIHEYTDQLSGCYVLKKILLYGFRGFASYVDTSKTVTVPGSSEQIRFRLYDKARNPKTFKLL
jgi:hypothetical protein